MKIITKNIPTKFVKLGELEIQIDEFEQIITVISAGAYINENKNLTKKLVKLKMIKYDKEYYVYYHGDLFTHYRDKFYDYIGSIF